MFIVADLVSLNDISYLSEMQKNKFQYSTYNYNFFCYSSWLCFP